MVLSLTGISSLCLLKLPAVICGPAQHSTARPQVADGGICEYVELAVGDS